MLLSLALAAHARGYVRTYVCLLALDLRLAGIHRFAAPDFLSNAAEWGDATFSPRLLSPCDAAGGAGDPRPWPFPFAGRLA